MSEAPSPRPIFEFDPGKAATNLRKHAVSFQEATTVFNDPLSATFPDELPSEDENRSVTVGLSSRQRLAGGPLIPATNPCPIHRAVVSCDEWV
jgi:hypothetical protein